MGYTTTFEGEIAVTPPLNVAEIAYLAKFAESRRMKRKAGPYYVNGSGFHGQGHDDDIIDYNRPDDTQPGLWCQWVPTEDGQRIKWNGAEKFYDSAEWMSYIIDHFLKAGAAAQAASDPQFNGFTFDHACEGVIYAQGEDADDRWWLVVNDNHVTSHEH